MKVLCRLRVSCLLAVSAITAGEPKSNWSGNYSPCDGHCDLLKKGHLNLGVRFATSNPELAAEFASALDFWATVLDMEWHEDNGRSCAIQVVDGSPKLFIQPETARA
ncbi:MAG: hypothetical protein JO336_12660 [Acidobacteriia bacterium]|nr:hypothetical protein [Terriglobia bacterium]